MVYSLWFDPSIRAEKSGCQLAPVVLLHEGLGSVSAWGRFPQLLADATNRRVLAYDRAGYGRSDPKPGPWPARFMHEEAKALHQVLQDEGLTEVLLVGHSDGATIGLLFPSQNPGSHIMVHGIVSISAHVMMEPICADQINKVRRDYTNGLQQALARHHDDADSTFDAWSEVWVSDRFSNWAIDNELAFISCPVVAIQGDADRYGSLAQLDRLAAGVLGPVAVHVLAGVDHWPHREASEQVLDLIAGSSFAQ